MTVRGAANKPANEASNASVAVRFLKWFGGGIILALSSWGAVAASQALVQSLHSDPPAPPPPISDQLQRIAETARDHKMLLTYERAYNMTGTGKRSWVLIFKPDYDQWVAVTDELEIYEEVHGRLRLALRFHPSPALALSILWDGDIDNNGSTEVILSGGEEYKSAPTHPLAVYWNIRKSRYEVIPIIRPKDPWGGLNITRPPAGTDAREWWSDYAKRLRVTSAGPPPISFRTYGGAEFIVRSFRQSTVLIGVFIMFEGTDGLTRLLAKSWTISLNRPKPYVQDCYHEVKLKWRVTEDLAVSTSRAWHRLRRWSC
jgi:hypothetical protein